MDTDLTKLSYALNGETKYNVWTIRITPPKNVAAALAAHVADGFVHSMSCRIYNMFEGLQENKFPKILVYEETSQREKVHYHARVCCLKTWATRKSLSDLFSSHFPECKGNGFYSTKKVHVNGKSYSSLLKSVTYIAKECELLFGRGYTDEEVKLIEKVGKEWKDSVSAPIYKKIIKTYNIDKRMKGSFVTRHVLDYYSKQGKEVPNYRQLCRILHLIKYSVDPEYRDVYKDAAAKHYDQMGHDPVY